MYILVNALIVALLVPWAPQKAQDGPACGAVLRGLNLLTSVTLASGVKVEGPWRLSYGGEVMPETGVTHFRMLAELDRVIRKDVLTGERREILLPEPVQLELEGTSQRELVYRAAQLWCVTVMRAQENRALDQISPAQPKPVRVALELRPAKRA